MRKFLRLLVALMMLLTAVMPAAAQGDTQGAAGGALRLNVGDVVQLTLPSEDAFNSPFKVDRDGNIDLPEAGPVSVAGLTIAQAREKVRAALAVSFRDLDHFALALKEHRLPLTVLGFVKQPGQIEIPAGSSAQIAINTAGGVTPGGQLDHMQVRRLGPDGQPQVIVFDYKKYLDTGDTRILPPLRPLDEIFVPASPQIGNVQVEFDARSLEAHGDAGEGGAVRVFGEVATSGTYAFKPGMTVMDALLRAGGVTRYAAVEQIRILPASGEPVLFNLKVFLDSGKQALNVPLQSGTTVFVPHEVEEVKSGGHVVYVMGEVAKPGAFEARPGTGFFDILANAGGPTRFAETKQIRIIRENGTVAAFDLAAYTDSTSGTRTPPPVVNPGDAIFVPEKVQSSEQASWLRTPPNRAVRVLGAVRSPGRFDWSDEMSLVDLIAQAGGPNERGDISHVEIVQGDKGKAVKFDLQNFMSNGGSAASMPAIHAGYTITVPELPQSPNDTRATWMQLSSDRSIYVMGSVGHPGRYAFEDKLSFLDIISAADGPTAQADLLNIRVSHRGEGRDRVTKVNLAAFFETGDDRLLPHVRPGDVIFVPDRSRNWLEVSPGSTVRLLGAIGKPGRYQFNEGMTILDLLAEAGGPSASAYQEKIVVVNLSCCANEARIFNLVKFAKSGDYALLPVVRQGDTIYVPSMEQSDWSIFMENVRDVVSVLSIFGLFKVLL
nr:SLBB domain-containing protein [uncultured Rhodopila sp.]